MTSPDTVPFVVPEEPISREIAGVLGSTVGRAYLPQQLSEMMNPEGYEAAQAIPDAGDRKWALEQVKGPVATAVTRSYIPQYLHTAGLYLQLGVVPDAPVRSQRLLYRAVPIEEAQGPAAQSNETEVTWMRPIDNVDKFQVSLPGTVYQRSVAENIAALLCSRPATGYRRGELADILYPDRVAEYIAAGVAGYDDLRTLQGNVQGSFRAWPVKVATWIAEQGFVLQQGKWTPHHKQMKLKTGKAWRAVAKGQELSQAENDPLGATVWGEYL